MSGYGSQVGDVEAELRDAGVDRLSDFSRADEVADVITSLAARASTMNDITRRQLKAHLIDRVEASKVIGGKAVVIEAFDAARRSAKRAALRPASLTDAWESQLTCGDRGFAASVGNVATIFRHHPEWRDVLAYNSRVGQIVFRSRPPFAAEDEPASITYPRDMRDVDAVRVAEWLERSKYTITLSPRSDVLDGAIAMTAERHSFDPVVTYLDGLTWDGAPRLDAALAAYFGAVAPDDDRARHDRYLAAVGAKWMIGAVARAYAPGCKVDHVLVLCGEQGIGKSTGGRILAGAEWFADSLPDLGSKDAADYLRGPWIIELSELEAIGRAELATIKAFLSRTTDRFRAAYGRRTESHARRCVFIASTNEDTYLRDATGNRRFWPVTVSRVFTAELARDRDQLWAEAVHRYRAGEPWHLTDDDVLASAREAQSERTVSDAWETPIATWIGNRDRVSVADVLTHAIELPTSRHDQIATNRVARVLTQLGWRKRRVRDGSSRSYGYFRATEAANV